MKKYTARYELNDINCDYCGDRKKTKYGTFGHRLCPHIMGNLNDLRSDEKFLEAVENAENCATNHRHTLRYLKKNGIQRNDCNNYSDNTTAKCNIKAECGECRYSGHGFICHGKDGSCLKDWLKKAENNGGAGHNGTS